MIHYPAAHIICEASSPDWEACRDKGLGASDMPTVLGVNPWGTLLKLYARKTGQLPREPSNHLQRIGHLLENYLAELLSEHHRRPLIQWPANSCLYRSRRYPWQLATPDGAFSESELIECKTITGRVASLLQLGTPGTDELPLSWIVQAQQQLAVTGADLVWFGVLIDNTDFASYCVPRNESLIGTITDQGRKFWELVEVRKEPPPDFGHDETASLLKLLHPATEGKVVTLPDHCLDQQGLIDACNAEINRLEKAKTHAQNVLRQAIGDAEIGILPGQGKALRRKTITRKPTEECSYETITKINWKE